MFIKDGKRFNIYQAQEFDGTRYAMFTDAALREKLGITEIPDPTPPEDFSDDFYYRNEQDTAPYVVFTRKSDEQINAVLAKRYEQRLDNHLDSVAQVNRYNDRFTFALRAGYTGPYQAEGIAFAQWMDACNVQAYTLLQSVLAGTVPAPTLDEFVAELPDFVMP